MIKFLGSIGDDLPGGYHSGETTLDLPDGARVKDIFDSFNIPADAEYSIIINNKIARPLNALKDGMSVIFVQAAYGG